MVLIDREVELPAGAIRVAPLEETVQGTIVFPSSQWHGRPVEGLRIEFENDSPAESGTHTIDVDLVGREGDVFARTSYVD